MILKIAKSYAKEREAQQDLLQEIFLQIWRSIPRFRHESSVSTWLYRISLNIAIRWARLEKKNSFTPLDDALHIVGEETFVDEKTKWMYRQIHSLDEIDRSVMLLLLEGLSYKEMAEILGISESNVGVKINRIKKRLKTESKNYDGNQF